MRLCRPGPRLCVLLGRQGTLVPCLEPSSPPGARQDLWHGPAFTARCSHCFQGACCTCGDMVGFLQILSVRHTGCGGHGEVNQSSTTVDRAARLINAGDRSAPMSCGNSPALSSLVCEAWMS